jgi:rhamnogalacturonyl hydrolase YesR
MSVYARIGNITGDPRYAQQAFKNFDFAAGSQGYQFWSQRDSLFYRDPPKWGQAYVPEGVYWSRGNGWAMGALVTALQFSGPADPHRAVYEGFFKRQAARLLRLQGARGCWPVSLTRPEADPAPETTGTALFAYGMAWGVRAGVLDAAEYGPALDRAWGCLSGTSLQQSGLVGYCQPVGDRPGGGGGANATSSFCVGQFLLAASALAQIAPQV